MRVRTPLALIKKESTVRKPELPTSNVPICRDCSFYKPEGDRGLALCTKYYGIEETGDLVNGISFYFSYKSCHNQRKILGMCRPEGLGFQPKPKIKPLLASAIILIVIGALIFLAGEFIASLILLEKKVIN